MDRIAIIGCGGSGKTHLANRLAALLSLPLTHLDGVYYDADWNPLPQEEFAAIQRDLVSAPRWLIEGNYAGTLPIRLAVADTVIFLDLPPVTCLVGIIQRRLRYRGGQHAQEGSTTDLLGTSSATSGATARPCVPGFGDFSPSTAAPCG